MTSPPLRRNPPSRHARARRALVLRSAGTLAALLALLASVAACGGGSGGGDTGATDVRLDSGGVVFPDGHVRDAGSGSDGATPDIVADADAAADDDATAPCTTDGACVGRVPAGPCLVARCEDGVCVAAPLEVGTACDDDDRCTGDGRCDGAGACAAGPTLPCADADPCTNDSCDPDQGCVHTRRGAGASCAAEGDPCDGSTCTADGACESRAKPNGFPCNTDGACDGSRCQGGVCVPTAAPDNKTCDDENSCTAEDHCLAGACVGAPKDCDDGDPCTSDDCNRQTGECTNEEAPTGTPCSDGDPCTDEDVCAAGVCLAGPPVACDDGDPCTTDACSPTTGWCIQDNAPNGTLCDDGDPCTTVDLCDAGYCVGTAPFSCDDGDPCTHDACDPRTGGCTTSPSPNGTACFGDDPCQVWSCQVGACVARGLKDCGDGNVCTNDACQPTTGECVHPPVTDGTGCDDDDRCTLDDACRAGVCTGGGGPDCDDGDPCTEDGCDGETGECWSAPGNDGAPCDDDEPCSAADRCVAGACRGTWDDPFCCLSDGDCAAFDACAPGTCVVGHCAYTAPECPPAEDGCATSVCDGASGACGEALLCGPHLVWGAGFEGEDGLHTWPPGAWQREGEAAAAGTHGLRLRAGAAAGAITAIGPPVRIPRGTAELRLRARVDAEDGFAADGALTARFEGVPGAEAVVAGPTEGWVTLSLLLGGPADQDGRLVLAYDGSRGVVDVDEVRLIHYGLNGCVRSRVRTIPTHAEAAEKVSISRGEGDDVLVGWAETRNSTGTPETEVSAALLDPLRGRSSTRRLVSTWETRTTDLRLRSARAPDGAFLLLYPAGAGSHSFDGAVLRDIAPVPQRFELPLDYGDAWAIDATAVAPRADAPWNGWVVLWSAPNADGEYNSLRAQRFGTDSAPLDETPWRGGPADWRDARHLEAAPLADDGRLAAWVARRVTEPFDQAILARRVATHLSPPPVSGGVLHVLTTADPAEGTLSHLRLSGLTDGFAVSVMRGEPDGSGPWQLEVRRFDLVATPLEPLDDAAQVAHASVLDSTPAPVVGLPDGGLAVVWRHRVATFEFVWYRLMDRDGGFHPAATEPPSALAGSALPFVSRGAPDAVAYAGDWILAAWPGGSDSIEYRALGVGCAEGLVRCYGLVAQVCAGDRYLPFEASCEGAGCGSLLTCQ